jgi:hypothetical protein
MTGPKPVARILLEHFSPIKGLRRISPAKAGSGSVVRGAEREWGAKVSHFFYPERGAIEDAFRGLHKYQVDATDLKLYDLARDPENILAKARRAALRKNGHLGAEVTRLAKEAGYDGLISIREAGDTYRRTVTTWRELPVLGAPPAIPVPTAAKRVAPVAPSILRPADAALLGVEAGGTGSFAEQTAMRARSPKLFTGKGLYPESEGMLFDPRIQPGSILQVPQQPIPRPEGPLSARGLEAQRERLAPYRQSLRSGGVQERAVEAGVKEGGHLWYNLDPVAASFVQEFGEEEGLRRFRLFSQATSAASARSTVPGEIRSGSYLYSQALQGNVPEAMPPGMGSLAFNTAHRPSMETFLSGQMPLQKVGGYAAAKEGNWTALVADAHQSRLGRLGDNPRIVDLAALDQIAGEAFQRMVDRGTLPSIAGRAPTASGQAAAWVGAAAKTGIKSNTAPWSRILEDRVYRTAKAYGVDPEFLWREVMNGRGLLYGLAPIAALAGVDSAP